MDCSTAAKNFRSDTGFENYATGRIALLGERQTEDLKVSGLIPTRQLFGVQKASDGKVAVGTFQVSQQLSQTPQIVAAP